MHPSRVWSPVLAAVMSAGLWGFHYAPEGPRLDRDRQRLVLGSLELGVSHPGPDRLEARRQGTVVYRVQSERLRFADGRPLVDFTGDGRPELVLDEGVGPKSVPGLLVLELEPTVRELGRVPAELWPVVEDTDDDGVFEIQVADRTFAYWQYCGADSPMPSLVLSWKEGAFRPDLDRMRGERPCLEALVARAREFRRPAVRSRRPWRDRLVSERGEVVAELVHELTGLIYSGHADLADRFLSETGWTRRPGEEGFARDFWRQARTSPWWPILRELNRDRLPAAARAGQTAGTTRLRNTSASSGSNWLPEWATISSNAASTERLFR